MPSPPIPVSDTAPRGQRIDINAAATYTGLSTKTLRRLIRSGQLRAYRAVSARAVRVDTADLDAMFVPTNGDAP